MKRNGLILGLLLALVQPSSAHDLVSGPHGGQVVDVKGHHVEFVAKGTAITLYLTDDKDGPIPSTGAQAKAVILDGGTSSNITLVPAEPNQLTGTVSAPLSAGAKVVVAGKLADGHEILARFVAK